MTDVLTQANSAPASQSVVPAHPPSSPPRPTPEMMADLANPSHDVRVVERFKISKDGKPDRYFVGHSLAQNLKVARLHFGYRANSRNAKVPSEKLELVSIMQVNPMRMDAAIKLAQAENEKVNPAEHETLDKIFDLPLRIWSEPLWEDSTGGDTQTLEQ